VSGFLAVSVSGLPLFAGNNYIKLSPYTTWTMDFSRFNDDIDFSEVSR
jgi:hypothetical protein